MSKDTKASTVSHAPDGTVSAFPTKKFFVSMLTRDIALDDAIMDLLDNCIDGIHRKLKGKPVKGDKPYDGFFGEITIDENNFILKDNCGGIPLKTAIDYAFKMGRDPDYRDDDNLQTVGMYGIGMKRAIFKIGLEAEVFSYHKDDQFKVDIPANWKDDADKWNFDYSTVPLSEIQSYLPTEGTLIKVGGLYDNIKKQFQNKAGFIKTLEGELRNHYGYIIQRGFRISLNGVDIGPLELNIITSKSDGIKSIKPYVYSSQIEDVEVEVMIGFYRPPASVEEIEKELDGGIARSSSENAGITVLCNDRVVLFCDKTFLTGWGEPPVPKYHTQFIAISGVVHFRSNNPIHLPVTTTKRGLDTSSAVYAEVKIRIKEGLKIFTGFTNNWKFATSEEKTRLFDNTETINALRPGQTKSKLISLKKKRGEESLYQIPDLPKPPKEQNDSLVSVSFKREREKVQAVADTYFPGEERSASDIGGWCFDQIYKQID